MEARRASRMVIDPKVRQVGFFTPGIPPDRSQSFPIESSSSPPGVSAMSPSGNSLSPVMIPPPRHASDNLSSSTTTAAAFQSSRAVPVPVPSSPLRRPLTGENISSSVSYNPSESLMSMSPTSKMDDGEFSEDGWYRNPAKVASSFPSGGFDMTSVRSNNVPATAAAAAPVASNLTTVSVVNNPAGVPGKAAGEPVEVQNERPSGSKSLKEKTSKAERRALQESQRAAKAAAKGKAAGEPVEVQNERPSGSKSLKENTSKAERRALQESQRAAKKAVAKAEGKAPAAASGGAAPANAKSNKSVKPPSQKKEVAQVAASEKKGSDRPPEKDRKKDAPPPRMQFDNKQRVDKAKRRAIVSQTEARNRVELFRHLPQYEHGTQLPDLESKFFQLDPMHPAVYKVGLRYLAGDISGGNARCIAMLQALKDAIRDYSTPAEKTLIRDLTAKIGSYVSFLIECRPLSISMGNAIKFLKNRVAKLPLTISESEAKETLQLDIDRFINEKIILADKVIVEHAVTKIRDGDVLLTYGSSSVVEMILIYAHKLGKQFRVVVVDSRPKLEGKALLRRLVERGLSCTYTHINAVSYIMHEVNRVFLGAASVLCNGTVYSRVGSASVAMVAHALGVPVLICCEAYKFHERVQLDSICSNELGNPDSVANVPGRKDINYLHNWTNYENLQLLNLIYDLMPSDYVSMIVTDYGMVPTTSVPAIVREYSREHLWI